MTLRMATELDLIRVQDIYNEVIANTTATFEENPRTLEEWQAGFRKKMETGRFPLIVAEVDGQVVGYGTYGSFRHASGYHTTVEHSLHVTPLFRGQGLGIHILKKLIGLARENGFHAMVAAVDSANVASIRLHEKCGFKIVGQMPQIARKFSKWLDLTLLQLTLEKS